ncbi:hypothetical protein CVT25_000795, partial [Psilocybe cyanescens]
RLNHSSFPSRAAIKELVTDANFECNKEGIVLQAMDNSHVALVSIKFDSDRIAEYDMKLMDIDADSLTIPETEYGACVTLPSSAFTLIVCDLSQLGESVRIELSKEGVRFASDGEAANGSVLLRQSDEGHVNGGTIKPIVEEDAEGAGDGAGEAKKEDEYEEGSGKAKKAKKPKIKKEKADEDIKMVEDDEDEDEESFKPKANDDDDDGQDENEDDEEEEDEDGDNKKRKKKVRKRHLRTLQKSKDLPKKLSKGKSKAKSSTNDDDDDDSAPAGVVIEMNQHVSLTFSLKYLVNFSKSANLSGKVQLLMRNGVPLLVAYDFTQGYIRYYLAPKIGDD